MMGLLAYSLIVLLSYSPVVMTTPEDSLIRHYLEVGELSKAEKICLRDTIKYPFLYGEVLYFNYKVERALDFYGRVPSDSRDANDALARIILIKGNDENELQSYATAELLGRRKKFEEGIELLEKLREKSKIGSWASLLLVEFLCKMGKVEEALQECARFIKIFPEDAKLPQVQLAMARIYVRMGKIDNARAEYRDILLKYPDSAVASIAREELENL